MLLLFVPAHRAYSLDCRAGRARAVSRVEAWCVWLLRFQIGVVYFFGAVAKLNPDWLLRAQPLRIWLGANVDLPLIGPYLQWSWVGFAMSYAGLAFDFLVVPALLWRRSRPFAYLAVLVFHLSTRVLFPIGIFPWLMIVLTPIFFEPDWPKRLLGSIAPRRDTAAKESATALLRPGVLRAAVVAAYVALQVSLPLRLWLHPGSAYWYEDGFRFSWQIMVMEKYGRISFTVSDPSGTQKVRVDPADYLTPLQLRMMATQPDMILSFARFIERSFVREMGLGPLRVRAESFVSLNGRPHQRFVDPTVDLASIRPDTPRTEWIVPLVN